MYCSHQFATIAAVSFGALSVIHVQRRFAGASLPVLAPGHTAVADGYVLVTASSRVLGRR